MKPEESVQEKTGHDTSRNPSLLGFRAFPNVTFDFMPTPYAWLDFKRKADCDDIEGVATDKLWRVHDSWYDLKGFSHPGGQDFIDITRGTDITELVESSHLDSEKINSLLKKYFVCKAQAPRNCLFDFQKTGFYVTLRTRVFEMMKALKDNKKPKKASYFGSMEFFHDYLLSGFLLFLALGLLLPSNLSLSTQTPADPSFPILPYIALTLSGILLSLVSISSHNFYHHKDNWRMYCFDLSGFSSLEWRISHVYSHHSYPNSLFDYEIMGFNDFLSYLPIPKSTLALIRSFAAVLIVFPLAMVMASFKRHVLLITGQMPLRFEHFLPLTLLASCYFLRLYAQPGVSDHVSASLYNLDVLWLCLVRLVYMSTVCSTSFLHIGLAATHHHPLVYHSGDVQPDVDNRITRMDWGVYQVMAVGHRPTIDKSAYLSLVSF
eukprot:gene42352-51727_t